MRPLRPAPRVAFAVPTEAFGVALPRNVGVVVPEPGTGLLFGRKFDHGQDNRSLYGIFQDYDYLDNKVYQFGGQSVGGGIFSIFNSESPMQVLTGAQLNWIILGGTNVGFQYDLDKPIESLAEGVLISVRDSMDSMFHQDRVLDGMIDGYGMDGVIYHPIKSCRTVSTGLADGRRYLTNKRDIATLFLESDMMDRRVVSEAQMKNRIDAFFEGLASRRQQAKIG